jgi:hypothetical protein
VDAQIFLDRVEAGLRALATGSSTSSLRAFQEALGVWGGEPLPEDAYEDWAQEYRTRLNRAYGQALEGAAASGMALGDPQAPGMAELAVLHEPLGEAGNLLLARALAASGNVPAALEALRTFRRRLADELGLDPSPEAFELESEILRGEYERPPRRTTSIPRAPLPVGELLFVGRNRELEDILQAVRSAAAARAHLGSCWIGEVTTARGGGRPFPRPGRRRTCFPAAAQRALGPGPRAAEGGSEP